MILIELEPDDFDRHGFAIIANVVSAITKVIQSDSGLNRFQAEHEAWPHILTGVKAGAIHPIDRGTRHSLSIDHCGDSVVRFGELVKWGRKTELYDFKKATSIAIDAQALTTEEGNDAFAIDAQRLHEEVGPNGEAISLRYWVHRVATPSAGQAARPETDKAPDAVRVAEAVQAGAPVTEHALVAAKLEPSAGVNASGNPRDVCDVFRAMKNLTADKVSIIFTGHKSETGLGNTMLTISANKVTRHVPVGNLDLVNRSNKSTLNKQGTILLGMAQKHGKFLRSDSHSTAITRLRNMFKVHLGITSDPFEPYRASVGWIPRFKITDKLSAADERAKHEAENYLTDSLEQMEEKGIQLAGTGEIDQSSTEEYPYRKEKSDKKYSYYNKDEKEADDWLENNDQQA